MNYHQNARLTVRSREELIRRVEAGSSLQLVAAEFGISPKTAGKWVRRFREQGPAGLEDLQFASEASAAAHVTGEGSSG